MENVSVSNGSSEILSQTFSKHNFRSGQILTASALNEIENEIVRLGSNSIGSGTMATNDSTTIYDIGSGCVGEFAISTEMYQKIAQDIDDGKNVILHGDISLEEYPFSEYFYFSELDESEECFVFTSLFLCLFLFGGDEPQAYIRFNKNYVLHVEDNASFNNDSSRELLSDLSDDELCVFLESARLGYASTLNKYVYFNNYECDEFFSFSHYDNDDELYYFTNDRSDYYIIASVVVDEDSSDTEVTTSVLFKKVKKAKQTHLYKLSYDSTTSSYKADSDEEFIQLYIDGMNKSYHVIRVIFEDGTSDFVAFERMDGPDPEGYYYFYYSSNNNTSTIRAKDGYIDYLAYSKRYDAKLKNIYIVADEEAESGYALQSGTTKEDVLQACEILLNGGTVMFNIVYMQDGEVWSRFSVAATEAMKYENNDECRIIANSMGLDTFGGRLSQICVDVERGYPSMAIFIYQLTPYEESDSPV